MSSTMLIDRESEPEFSQPITQIVAMLLITAAFVAVAIFLFVSTGPDGEPSFIRRVFEQNLYFNTVIALAFVTGVLACLLQVFQLTFSVRWIEGFAVNRPGHEFTRAPRLLASLSALLRGKDARRLLTSSSTKSILDSVATRLDEARDITRYIVNLLIFLGLLGTFWGLANTVPAVVDTIRSLAPQAGEEGIAVFDRLMTGLESQLGGMGTAFSTSLLGLAGSLVVGLLELFAGHGQNRFYRELEEWLSSITRIGLTSGDGEGGGGDNSVLLGLVEQTGLQLESLNETMRRSEEARHAMDERMIGLTDSVRALLQEGAAGQSEIVGRALDRLAEGQEQIARALRERGGDDEQGDAESRMRLRNIDVQLLRILEEMSAGRQDSVAEIRTELNTLSRTIAAMAERGR